VIYVECFGLPASGKSFLSGILCDALRRAGKSVFSREEALSICRSRSEGGMASLLVRAWSREHRKQSLSYRPSIEALSTFAASNVQLLASVFSLVKGKGLDQDELRRGINNLFRSCVEFQMVHESFGTGDIVVFDEGLAHRCFTLFGYTEGSLAPEETAAYVRAMPKIDFSLWADVDPEASEDRIVGRGSPPPRHWFAGLSRQERVARLRNGRGILKSIAGFLAEGGEEITRIDNNGTIDAVRPEIEKLAGRIAEHAGG
jgi:hypothetical protein